VNSSYEAMLTLQEQLGLSVFLTIWSNKGPTIIAKVDGHLPIPVTIKKGYVLPLMSSATGKVYLSMLPRTKTGEVLKDEIGHIAPHETVIQAAIREVKTNGVSLSEGQLNDGFGAISAPIW